ncbi:MAG TPA: four helix bundle protein [Phycisphaerales bacterium]|nr:four helix bundle protein [Phycisphaerales bacterium]
MGQPVRSHRQLEGYKRSFEAARGGFRLSRQFPPEERYSLTDQIRRSSRSVGGAITEGWRKRRYEASFINRINDAEGEALAGPRR